MGALSALSGLFGGSSQSSSASASIGVTLSTPNVVNAGISFDSPDSGIGTGVVGSNPSTVSTSTPTSIAEPQGNNAGEPAAAGGLPAGSSLTTLLLIGAAVAAFVALKSLVKK
jgi:hypothetical protein